MRDPVSPGVKLAVTLSHLASSTIEKFVPEVCDAITGTHRDQVMQCPTLPEDWIGSRVNFRCSNFQAH